MGSTPLQSSLHGIYPASRIIVHDAGLVSYESDGLTAFRERPLAVVLPETSDELIRTVRWCHEQRVPFVARGNGTSLSGGSLPVKNGIVISMNRMNRILRLDPVERLAVVEPGVINLNVTKSATPYGLLYAPDPSSQTVCTIGGNVAFNSGGAHCLKYGMTSNHVLGLKIVLPDGTLDVLGGESLECSGPDYVGMFVGSEGLFGIAYEITLRLIPKPEVYRTIMCAYRSLREAGQVVSEIIASGLLPGAMEIMDNLSIQAAEAAVHPGYPLDAAGLLIVELEGEASQVAAEFERLSVLIASSKPYLVKEAQNAQERLQIWKGRKSAFSAVGRLSPDFIVQDGVVPRGRLGEALEEIQRLSQLHGIRVANVFHAGDGNLHPLILYDGKQEGALHRAELLAAEIIELCIRYGGSITGEHGVGMEKRSFLPKMFQPDDMDCMWRVRREVDPHLIANPGKMLMEGDAPALTTSGLHPLEKAGVISRE
jgi:glycolate oxidase